MARLRPVLLSYVSSPFFTLIGCQTKKSEPNVQTVVQYKEVGVDQMYLLLVLSPVMLFSLFTERPEPSFYLCGRF